MAFYDDTDVNIKSDSSESAVDATESTVKCAETSVNTGRTRGNSGTDTACHITRGNSDTV